MRHLQILEIKYYGATNKKRDRIRIKDTRFEQTIWLSRNYKNDFLTQAEIFLEQIGYTIIAYARNKEYSLFLVDDFQPIKEMKKNAENK